MRLLPRLHTGSDWYHLASRFLSPGLTSELLFELRFFWQDFHLELPMCSHHRGSWGHGEKLKCLCLSPIGTSDFCSLLVMLMFVLM